MVGLNVLYKKELQFWWIRFQRYALLRDKITVLGGPLKGYQWKSSSNYAYVIGDYEDSETLSLIKEYLSLRPPVFYDIGANIGYYSFIANALISEGTIYAFEPFPENLATFQTLIGLNAKHLGQTQIELLPFAISDKVQDVMFSNNPVAIEGNTYKDSAFLRDVGPKLKVKSYSIDALVQLGYKPPTVMKIDVEGAELDLLRGAVNVLRKYRPHIFLATHDVHVSGVKNACVEFLRDMGYSLTQSRYHKKNIAGLDDFIAVHKDWARLNN